MSAGGGETTETTAPREDLVDELPRMPLAEIAANARRIRDAEAAAEERRQTELSAEIAAGLERARARAERRMAERVRLPCYEAAERGDVTAGAAACERAGAWRQCVWGAVPEWCARERDAATYRAARERLVRGRVEPRELELILACVPGRRDRDGRRLPTVPLEDTDALVVVRRWLTRSPATVDLDGEPLVLQGGETTLVLSGPPGVGKTAAAVYASARDGGLYVSARALVRRDGPVEEAERAPLLCLDDLGVEYSSDSGWAVGVIAGVLDARHARRLRTVITTNLLRRRRVGRDDAPQFAERYGERVDDRLRDGGLYVVLGGESRRGR